MKPTERILQVDDQLAGEKVAMSVEQSAMGHIMMILTDLYSDPELATVREIATNARDANIEAGNGDLPIDITLPTDAEPNLVIRDYGKGLDADDIRYIYSRYGASTKRDSDDVVGMLGLGCKSPLAYTDQFTLTGIKNGVATVVNVSRTEDGGGDMTLVSTYETDEPSGTTVIVPAKRNNDFTDKANDLFRFWKPGTVRIDGQEPKMVDGFWIADDLLLTPDVKRDMIVMGGVPYPMKDVPSYVSSKKHSWATVAFVEIGAVNFVPSREQLMFNSRTKAMVTTIENRVADELGPAIERQVEAAQSTEEALAVALMGDTLGYREKLYWRGIEIPTSYDFKESFPLSTYEYEKSDGTKETRTEYQSGVLVLKGEKKHRVREDSIEKVIPASTLRNSVIFTGYKLTTWSATKREKLEQWLNKQDMERPTNWLLMPYIPEDLKPWITDEQVFDFDTTVGAEKLPSTSKRVDEYGNRIRKPKGLYPVKTQGDEQEIEAGNIDTSKPIFYTGKNIMHAIPPRWGSDIKEKRESDSKIIFSEHPDAQVVLLAANRYDKFKRDFPQAIDVDEYNAKAKERWLNSLSDDEKLYLHLDLEYDRQYFAAFDAERCDDPDFAKVVKVAKLESGEAIRKAYNLYQERPEVKFNDPRDKYPLLPEGTIGKKETDKMEHALFYMRAVYFGRLGGQPV